MARMRVRNALLANYSEGRDGIAYISGAFPEWWEVPQLPHGVQFHAILQLELEPNEVEEQFLFHVSLRRPNGDTDLLVQVVTKRGPFKDPVEGQPIYHILPIPIPATLNATGRHTFQFIVADVEPVLIPIAVKLVPPIQPPEGFEDFTRNVPPPAPGR
jgi:hypothetical protein